MSKESLVRLTHANGSVVRVTKDKAATLGSAWTEVKPPKAEPKKSDSSKSDTK